MLKVIACSIRTTGSDPSKHQIIEMGVYADDCISTINRLFKYHTYIIHNSLLFEPKYLVDTEISRAYENITSKKKPFEYIYSEDVAPELREILQSALGYKPDGKDIVSITLLGTDVEKSFLESLPMWRRYLKIDNVIDPRILFLRREDDKLPTIEDCLFRARLLGTAPPVSVLEHSEVSLKLYRNKLGINIEAENSN